MLRQALLFVMLSAPAWSQCASTWDPTIGAPGANNAVDAFATFDEGAGPRLFAGGEFTQMGGVSAVHIARWDGTSWTAVGTGFDGPVYALAVYDDGSGRALYAGGSFHHAGGSPAANIARWNGTVWSALGLGTDAAVRAFVLHDDGTGFGPSLFIGGEFAHAGGIPSSLIARFNSGGFSPVGSLAGAAADLIMDLAVYDDGLGAGRLLYASGYFSGRLLQRWNGTTWMNAPPGGPADPSVLAVGNALCVFDDGAGPALFLGGTFDNGDFHNIARLDASGWSSMNGGMFLGDFCSVNDLIVHDDGDGPALWATGAFGFAGEIGAGSLARWNGTTWSAPADSLTYVNTVGYGFRLASYDDGHGRALFVGGYFDHCGNLVMHSVGRRSAAGGLPIVGTPSGPTSAGVNDVVQFKVTPTGTGPFSYVWHGPPNGFALPGANAPTLTVQVGLPSQSQGDYWVVVTGPCGRTGSSKVHLSVHPNPGVAFCACDANAPCGNLATIPTAGCMNSLGTSARLSAQGLASLTNDSVVLLGWNMTNSSALYFQGTSAIPAGAAFGDGLRCAAGTVVRLGVRTNVNGASQYPGPADLLLSMVGGLTPNATRVYQVWYRDAASFCTSATYNLTNGLSVTWNP